MTARKQFGFLSIVSLLAVFMLIGCGSSGEDPFDPNVIPPSITGLDRNAADIGDAVVVTGLRFGATRGGSSVSLNGLQFQVQDADWSDTQITVNVEQGMTSGIVVVEVSGVSSQSGTEAQLFIPTAPTGDPLISAVSPNFGREGLDEILVLGFNFGDGSGDSGVYFPAQGGAVSQVSGSVLAPVVDVMINGEPVPQWTNSSIKVTVPDLSMSGSIFVKVDGVVSNEVAFTVLPKELTGPPMIFTQDNLPPGLSPAIGGENTSVVISGENFGSQQGSSTIKINDLPLGVVSWTTGEIVALIPAGAQTGTVRVTVGDEFADSATFLVENQPFISGLIPSVMRVGQPLRVTGHFFGPEQGTGSLRVGNTTVPVDSWSDSEISVLELPAVSYGNGDAVAVQVTANSGLSDSALGSVETPLVVYVLTPNPNQGEAGTTEFNIFVTVVGGSGNYQYTFTADSSFPGEIDAPVTSLPMRHTYPESKVTQPTVFSTRIKVRDMDTSDEVIVDGPQLNLVPQGQGVISGIEVMNFNNGIIPSPKNDLVYSVDGADYLYHDFTFFGGDVFYGSALGEYDDAGTPVAGVTRDLGSFMSGSPTARPYGYRYEGSQGSIVRIVGLNLGTAGTIYLDSDAIDDLGYEVPATDLVGGGWTPESVDFYIPEDAVQNLSGKVAIVTPTTSVISSTELVCSAYIRTISPTTPIALDAQFQVSAYDLEPPEIADMTGDDTYFIFQVQADYQDPFLGIPASGPALLASPMPADPAGPQVLFDMSTIPAETTVEVLNGDFTQGAFVQGTIVGGNWQGFIWTGALSSGTQFNQANSGIFSQTFMIETTGGAGPPGDTWSVSGSTRNSMTMPSSPIPGIDVHITSTTGPAYNDTVTSDGSANYTFTNVPGDEEYEVWCDDPAWNWPGPFPIGPLVEDLGFISINANGPA